MSLELLTGLCLVIVGVWCFAVGVLYPDKNRLRFYVLVPAALLFVHGVVIIMRGTL